MNTISYRGAPVGANSHQPPDLETPYDSSWKHDGSGPLEWRHQAMDADSALGAAAHWGAAGVTTTLGATSIMLAANAKGRAGIRGASVALAAATGASLVGTILGEPIGHERHRRGWHRRCRGRWRARRRRCVAAHEACRVAALGIAGGVSTSIAAGTAAARSTLVEGAQELPVNADYEQWKSEWDAWE
jgi:hypothetical protein